MSISAKELAKLLKLTPAAVSMALNGKPGVSSETRRQVMEAAEQYGYDFSRLAKKRLSGGSIAFIIYRRQGAVVGDTPFFSQLSEGIEAGCKIAGLRLQVHYLYHQDEGMTSQLRDILYSGCGGVILLATEMLQEDYAACRRLPVPLVLLDGYFDFARHDGVLIDNVQGAFVATDYLISRRKSQPGYLHSAYPIGNFEERSNGFYKAVRKHGLSASKSILHGLSPSVEGAQADMTAILESGEEIADCYFADNDLIAIGAMKAFAARGMKIPQDVGIIGFDDIAPASYVEPALTTIHVPKQYMGEMAAKRLVERMGSKSHLPVKIEIGTRLMKRASV